MMKSYAMRKEYYEAIKERVTTENPYFYTETWGSEEREMVEVDVNEEEFEAISKEMGWN